jgi:hypothetical protein
MEALGWGRAAVLASAFRSALNEEGEEGIDATSVRVAKGYFEFRVARETCLPWTEETALKPGDTIAVLPRPRPELSFEPYLLEANAKALAREAANATRRFILQSAESSVALDARVVPILSGLSVTTIASPYTLPDLDNLVDAKFMRAKRVRR